MKKIYFILSLFLLSTLAASAQKTVGSRTGTGDHTLKPDTATAKEKAFAHKVWNAFVQRDAQLWQSLYPTREEYAMLVQAMRDAHVRGFEEKRINGMLAARDEEFTNACQQEWNRLTKKANQLRINWKTAVYSDFTFDTIQTSISRKYLSGDIWFNIGKGEYVIENIEAVETTAGYKLQSIKDITKIEDEY